MSRSKRAPWVKLYTDFTSTPSHDGLDAITLWVGVCVLLIVRASNDARGTRDPWALHEDGSAVNIRAIAQRARVSLAVASKAIAALASRGTVAWREDAVLGVPKFWEYQETPDARRKRDGKSAESPPGVRDDSNQEDRGKRKEITKTAPTEPSPPEADRTESQTAKARRVLDAHEDLRVRHGIGRRRGFNPSARESGTPAILRLIAHVRKREECDEETAIGHILAKLERGCRDAAAGQIERRWVNGPTAWRTTAYDAACDSQRPEPVDLRAHYQAELARTRGQA